MVFTSAEYERAYKGGVVIYEGMVQRVAQQGDFITKQDGTEVPSNDVVFMSRQVGGGNPGPSYSAEAMAADMDDLRAVVVIWPDRVEKWV